MILVTGTSGFIGKHLLKGLIGKYGKNNILAFTSTPTNDCTYLLHNNYNFDIDYINNSGFGEIEIIIHAGAYIPKKSNQSNDFELCTSNIFNTHEIINSYLPKLKQFIFLSTVDVYANIEPIIESSPTIPISLYGNSKLYCEKMIHSWADSKNISNIILRIGHVYGPGEEKYQKLIPLIMRQIIDGKPIHMYGEGKELRTFIFISDVVDAIIKSIELESTNDVFNIVGSEQTSVKELIYEIIKISNQQVEVNEVKSDSMPRNLVFDNQKMKDFLHTPKVSLSEGLQIEWNYMNSL